MIPECHHIKTSGGKCGSPALRGELYCYFHSRPRQRTSQRPRRLLRKELANLEDRGAIQRAITEVAKAVAENQIEPGAPASSSTPSRSPPETRKRPGRPFPARPSPSRQPKVLIPATLRLSSIESAMDRLYRQLKPLKATGSLQRWGYPYQDVLKSLTRPPISR